jgi:hypothetical protein
MKFILFLSVLIGATLFFACKKAIIYSEDAAIVQTQLLSDHQTVAVYDGAVYHVCSGLTSACPETCGASGEYAQFKISEYKVYAKSGEYGDAKTDVFSYQISDFNKKSLKDTKWITEIKALKKGQKVFLHWQHRYGAVRSPNSLGPIRPIIALTKM